MRLITAHQSTAFGQLDVVAMEDQGVPSRYMVGTLQERTNPNSSMREVTGVTFQHVGTKRPALNGMTPLLLLGILEDYLTQTIAVHPAPEILTARAQIQTAISALQLMVTKPLPVQSVPPAIPSTGVPFIPQSAPAPAPVARSVPPVPPTPALPAPPPGTPIATAAKIGSLHMNPNA